MEAIDPARITLRPFELSDADDLLLWAGDDRVTSNLNSWTTVTSWEQALATIRDVCIPNLWLRAICIDGRSVGFIYALPRSGDDRCRAKIGYGVAPDYWGKGIATRAVKLVLSRVFQDLTEVVRIEALVDVQNLGSAWVLEKAGFMQEDLLRKYAYLKGDIKDVYMYSFLSTVSILMD